MGKKTQASVEKKDNQIKQEKLMKVSIEVQTVLESNGFALQPFMIRSEFGDRPSVRLVEVPANQDINVKQGTDSGETEATEDTAKPTEAPQS